MPQPFVNPYYFSQYPQYQQNYSQQMQTNPYMQRMDNMQQYQQPISQPAAQNQFVSLGKMVESIDIVKATDIPIDGSMYYFPKADGTEIYGKRWLPNGTTEIISYKPILEPQNEQASILSNNEEKLKFNAFTEVLEGIQNDIKTLNDKIDRMAKPTKAKKEVAEDAE